MRASPVLPLAILALGLTSCGGPEQACPNPSSPEGVCYFNPLKLESLARRSWNVYREGHEYSLPLAAGPVLYKNTAYFASAFGEIVRVDLADGRRRVAQRIMPSLKHLVRCGPILVASREFVPGSSEGPPGLLVAFHLDEGRIIWKKGFDAYVRTLVPEDPNRVLAVTDDGELYRLDAREGQILGVRRFARSLAGDVQPTPNGIVAGNGNRVHLLNAETLKVRWETRFPDEEKLFDRDQFSMDCLAFEGDKIFAIRSAQGGNADHAVVVLEVATGQSGVLFKLPQNEPIRSELFVENGFLFFGTATAVYALDSRLKQIAWKADTSVRSGLVSRGDRLFTLAETGLWALDKRTGKVIDSTRSVPRGSLYGTEHGFLIVRRDGEIVGMTCGHQ